MQPYLEEARALAIILGFDVAGVVGLPGDERFVSDPTSSHFGEQVPPQIDDVWLHAVKVADGRTFVSYLSLSRGGAGRDPWVVGDERDPDGGRFIEFRDPARWAKEAVVPGWPLQGRRAAREAVVALRDGGQGASGDHHITWLRRKGVAERSNVVWEHPMICVALRMMQQFDKLDLYNVSGAEYLIRRLRQLEAAVRKNPRAPDFQGLDLVLDTAVDDTGARALAQTMKAKRQRQEETTAALPRAPPKGGAAGSGG
ncbi:unnamed protein product [Prorocentrum cordatum]|uniref:Uncharacterized protein n=1 Tax=Prorocentrum cordatum TaxID=2364126 RepID=A0ABN9VG84_9DINO|nr:unnamed protein product [Polarella glacialis]